VEELERRCLLSLPAVPAFHLFTVPIGPLPAAHVGATVQPAAFPLPIAPKPPQISAFGIVDDYGVLMIKGTVTDGGTPVEGLKVAIGGVLAKYHLTATVLEDGTFSVGMKIPPGGVSGTATAQTHDHNGLPSNIAMDWILGTP
jgi:hypothetical protein